MSGIDASRSVRLVAGLVVGVGLLAWPAAANGQEPVGTAFTYQGELDSGGTPVDNMCNFQFTLWDDAVDPSPLAQIGSTISGPVDVVEGRMTTVLDFGENVFNGGARWLQIAVCCPSPCGSFTTLSPRQELTPTPYALALPGLYTQEAATAPNIIGGFSGNAVETGMAGATISGGGFAGEPNSVADLRGTVGGGSNNTAGSADANINTAQYATVGGGRGNTAGGEYSFVGGGQNNNTGDRSAVAGGQTNSATGAWSFIGGGQSSTATGANSTVGGGGGNDSTDTFSTVAGGWENTASGFASAVPGGQLNTAGGDYSQAAGLRAQAIHDGAFVWGDSTDADFASTAANQFLIRATGGVGIGTAAPTEQLTVAGMVGSTTGGFKLPDGTIVDEAADLGVADGDTLGGLSCANGQVAKWNGSAWACAADDVGSGSTLDQAYDEGGPGAGRTIVADAGAVVIDGAGGLEVAATIRSGNSIIIDGAAGSEKISSSADLEIHVLNGRVMRYETDSTSPNIIGGHVDNVVIDGVAGATIAGGGATAASQQAHDNYATISGGRNNQAGSTDADPSTAQYATIGGGAANIASGSWSTIGGGKVNTAYDSAATVAGGDSNLAGPWAAVGGGQINHATGANSTVGGGGGNDSTNTFSTVAGGWENTASGFSSAVGGGKDNVASNNQSTVGGGEGNVAAGQWSTVPGGLLNRADGQYSQAAGRRAMAMHNGANVWGDSTDADFASTGSNQFLIRAAGGVGIGTNAPTDPLTVAGVVRSTTGGFEFPDGSLQTTASVAGSDTAGQPVLRRRADRQVERNADGLGVRQRRNRFGGRRR